jgi:RNA 2',3'-cyclic 3'-phosphodiesterase
MRLFVAVDLSDEARQKVALEQKRIAEALKSDRSLKWVKPEQAHLTLVFLGNVDDLLVPAVIDSLGRDVGKPAFDMVLDGVGVFPPHRAPRVLWLGIREGADALIDLQRDLAARVKALDLPVEDRVFHPHLTLARWKESRAADRERALSAAHGGVTARTRVECATLYQSRLSPSGAAYTPLARANLTSR